MKYKVAKILGGLTGQKYHVDHIIPLRHPLVAGLHHEDNLQILLGRDNRSKGNRFIPGEHKDGGVLSPYYN